MTPDPVRPGRMLPRHVAALVVLVFLAVLVRTAWISDDGLISLRTVMNVTHGHGLTFNIGERVQTFTHPLWLALLTAGYLVYIASIGGDFMSGRFFAVPFFAAVLVLTRFVEADRRTWIATVSACVLLGAVSARMPLMSDSRYED